MAELAGVRNPLAYMPPDLEGMEFAVYDLCCVRKMSIRKAAEKLKVSKDEIFRLRQKISSKISKSATTKNRKSKKNEKLL
jgi:transposase